jgi:hypothetical protein
MDACREVGIIPIVGCECYYRERRVTRAQVEAMRKNGEDVEPSSPTTTWSCWPRTSAAGGRCRS